MAILFSMTGWPVCQGFIAATHIAIIEHVVEYHAHLSIVLSIAFE